MDLRAVSECLLTDLSDQTVAADHLPESGAQLGGFHGGSMCSGPLHETRTRHTTATVL